jgi:dihydrofolate reductase
MLCLASRLEGMTDISPQIAAGKVCLHFAMSLDGFVAGPGHSMDFLAGSTTRPGLVQEYIETTGAVLAGRDGFDSAIGDSRPYGGAWQGPIFVLTHHPEDATPTPDITFLSCPVEEAVRIGLEAAGGKNLEVFSPTIGKQLLQLGLVDEIDLHLAPVLLGDGIRLYDAPGGRPIHLQRADAEPTLCASVRYHPPRVTPTPADR